MLRRDAEGWRELGPFIWRIERQDNYGDRSTTTSLRFVFIAHWSLDLEFTRGWREDDEDDD